MVIAIFRPRRAYWRGFSFGVVDVSKLTDKQKKQIIADFVDLGSFRAAARKNGVAPNTVRTLVNQDNQTARLCTEKKDQNTVEILEALGSQTHKVIAFCEESLDRLREVLPYAKNVRDIATAVGIMIDKYTAIAPKPKDESGPFDLPARVLAPSFASVFMALVDELYTEYELAGGRGSTKSSFVSLVIVWLLKNNPDFHAVCIRKVGNTLRDSVYAQILWAITILGLDADFDSTVSPMEVTLTATGQKIYFRGADDPKKLKSITPPFGYIAVLWFEELDQFAGDNEVRNIRQSVIRGGEKGPGSVDYSMKWLQSLTQIVIDPVRCPDTYKEFTRYEYERTKDGDIISGYPDKDNHHIDAVRYGMESVWKRRGQ